MSTPNPTSPEPPTNPRDIIHPSREAKHLLADIVQGVRPPLSQALIELKWRGIIDADRRPTDLALRQPWL